MKKRNYFSDIEDRNENAFSVIADFEGNWCVRQKRKVHI